MKYFKEKLNAKNAYLFEDDIDEDHNGIRR
jgi:hypothetical protein